MNVGTRCKIITTYGVKFLSLYEELLKELEIMAYNMEHFKYVDVQDFMDYIGSYRENENMCKKANKVREILVSLLVHEGFTVDNDRSKFCDAMFTVILRED